jgi:hypothetical protein
MEGGDSHRGPCRHRWRWVQAGDEEADVRNFDGGWELAGREKRWPESMGSIL